MYALRTHQLFALPHGLAVRLVEQVAFNRLLLLSEVHRSAPLALTVEPALLPSQQVVGSVVVTPEPPQPGQERCLLGSVARYVNHSCLLLRLHLVRLPDLRMNRVPPLVPRQRAGRAVPRVALEPAPSPHSKRVLRSVARPRHASRVSSHIAAALAAAPPRA